MSEEVLTEYGGQKSLQEIIEDLAVHCMAITGKDAQFKIMLPKEVVEKFNSSFSAKQRIGTPVEGIKISKMYVAGGVCRVYDTEDYAVVKVEK